MANESSFSGPYIQAALICEKMLAEPGNVPTFVRVVDRFDVPKFAGPLPPGVQMMPQVIQFTLVIMLKSGDLGSGRHDLVIRLQKPDGSYAPEGHVPIFFQGSQENGAMAALPVVMPNPEEGLHWFDVIFEGSLITRVPMRVLYQPTPLPIQASGAPQGG